MLIDIIISTIGSTSFGVADGKDHVYIVSNDGIYVFDIEGNYQTHWGSRGSGSGKYDSPNGIAVDPQNNRVQIWQMATPLPEPPQEDSQKFLNSLKTM